MLNSIQNSTTSAMVSLLIAVLLMFWCSPAVSQSPSREESLNYLKQRTEEIRSALDSSNHEIEIGNFEHAEQLTEKNLDKIRDLADLFMPLPERIKELISQEQKILADTRQSVTSKEQNQRIDQEAKQTLTRGQIKNRDDTLKPIQQLENQLLAFQKEPQGTEKDKGGDLAKQQKLLNDINVLLKSAYSSQDQAASFLNQSRFAAAVPEEERSIQQLKQALDKLSSKQKKGPNQQQSQNQQKKQPSQPNQNNDDQKQNPQSQPSSGKEKKQDTQKLSAQEALKELAKLRKKSAEEKKRRERAYGKAAIPQRAPVEKDW